MFKTSSWYLRVLVWFVMAGVFVSSLGGASILSPSLLEGSGQLRYYRGASATLQELQRLGLLTGAGQQTVEELLRYQSTSRKSLAQILREPLWLQRLGYSANSYKATWYAANPFDLLPIGLKSAIRRMQQQEKRFPHSSA